MANKPIRLFRMNVDRLNDFTIGRETENHAAAVEINLSRWLSIWPDGIPAIWLLRPGENTRYPAVTEREGDVIRWLVRDYDVALPGVARMEMTLQDGENIAISAAAFVTIAHRIGKTEGEAGEVEPDWSKNVIEKTAENAERAEDAAKRAQQIVEEFETGEGGGITNETDPTVPSWAKQPEKPTYTAEEVGAQPKGDYALKSEIPAIPVQSVNGKTGKVELTAEDVGALPEDTIIPAPYELPTASATVKGGVKVGNGLVMDGETLGVKPENEWELINTITATEAVSQITITTDSSGKQLKLKKARIRVTTAAASANQSASASAVLESGSWLVLYADAVLHTVGKVIVYEWWNDGIAMNGNMIGPVNTDATEWVATLRSITPVRLCKIRTSNIAKVVFTSSTIPAGTVVELYGVRADA